MNLKFENKTILIAPLNWGLGHATRCIPIIKALLEYNFTPIIASDGIALELLRKEFPYLKTLELPSYHIEYAKNGKNFKWKLLKNLPRMMAAIHEEKKIIKNWIQKYEIEGIISDNRLGVYNSKIPCVFVTHQLNVLTGNTTWITSKLHQNIIKKFTACWIPDSNTTKNLSGTLGHIKNNSLNLRYIGPLSRMNVLSLPKEYDLMILLSGPEPQRGLLEDLLREEVKRYKGKVVFIKGIIEPEQKKEQIDHVTYFNFMKSRQLEHTFNQSHLILCRSGYTSIMDLVKLNKKAFFIPTPGQYEQIYLAEKMQDEACLPYARQEDFKIEDLSKIEQYKGLPQINSKVDWEELFNIF